MTKQEDGRHSGFQWHNAYWKFMDYVLKREKVDWKLVIAQHRQTLLRRLLAYILYRLKMWMCYPPEKKAEK